MRLSLKQGFLYLFLFIFIGFPIYWFGFILPLGKTTKLINELPKLVNESVVGQFPPDLIVQVADGTVTLNKPLPYCLEIAVPPPADAPDVSDLKVGILFVEEVDQETMTALQNTGTVYRDLCSPFMVIGQTTYVTNDPDTGELSIQPIPKEVSVVATQEFLTDLVETQGPRIAGLIQAAYYIGPFILALSLYAGFLLLNFWYASVTLVFFKLFKKAQTRPFSHYYMSSLYSQIAWQSIIWTLNVIVFKTLAQSTFQLGVPFLGTIVIVALNVFVLKNHPLSNETPPSPDGENTSDEQSSELPSHTPEELAAIKATVIQAPPPTPAPDLTKLYPQLAGQPTTGTTQAKNQATVTFEVPPTTNAAPITTPPTA
jgi:hypothetical protein